MPSFDVQCVDEKCAKVVTVTFQFSEFDEVQYVRCPECGSETKRIYHQSGAQVFLPTKFGVTKKGFI